MNEKESDGPCEKCGYSNDAPYLPSYLAPGTILNDRYIVGKLLSYNGEGATYIGFDKVDGCKGHRQGIYAGYALLTQEGRSSDSG